MYDSIVCLLLLVYCRVYIADNSFIENDQSYQIRRQRNDGSSTDFFRTWRTNNKPMFINCANYSTTIKEEEPIDTFVIQVNATDSDPEDAGGSITYKLLQREGNGRFFNIDSRTGIITTNIKFDRDIDEPIESSLFIKETYLSVQATDNGKPQLSDVCTFRVEISDVNDNSPIFNEDENTTILVPQDAPIKHVVMQVSATDFDDGKNAELTYSLKDDTYFTIGESTGIVEVKQSLKDFPLHNTTRLSVIVTDNGIESKSSSAMDFIIKIVSSKQKAPEIIDYPKTIELFENYSNNKVPISGAIKAKSNDDKGILLFYLLTGKTEQTNKKKTFRIEPNGNEAMLFLSTSLDCEKIKEYILTVTVVNLYHTTSLVNIRVIVKDVNDCTPYFNEEKVDGSVYENRKPGEIVMQLKAYDLDETQINRDLIYYIRNDSNFFSIDENGIIRTLVEFDHEETPFYIIIVVAENIAKGNYDETVNYLHNIVIHIEDVNDNAPMFSKEQYTVDNIKETTKTQTVFKIQATDIDTNSEIHYKIIEGNINDAFSIHETSGEIRVKNSLDYETTTEYNLTVFAFDGIYNATTKVHILVVNVNDNVPQFTTFSKNITIDEGRLYDECLVIVNAYDPDKLVDVVELKILESSDRFEIDNSGCLKLKKELDRDPPFGESIQQCVVEAYDGLQNVITILFHLNDINDNAPFLNISSVVWFENEKPGPILKLMAIDYDTEINGPPFYFELMNYQNEFSIRNDVLIALVSFDREFNKFLDVRIKITDNGTIPMSKISVLRVVIGDRNDNEMKSATSSINVYKFKNNLENFQIGRVFVADFDDWDLNDKQFQLCNDSPIYFSVDSSTGIISMESSTPSGKFDLLFNVTEKIFQRYHSVIAVVKVFIKTLSDVAIYRSGSIRFSDISAEDFIFNNNIVSKKDLLHTHIAKALNVSEDNVDIFMVYENHGYLDVRYSVHGSPYYAPEKLNFKLGLSASQIESMLNASIVMINIDECLSEQVCSGMSCTNTLIINRSSVAAVYTNVTSFIGIPAIVRYSCNCNPSCSNGVYESSLLNCSCATGLEQEKCEATSAKFEKRNYAVYSTFRSCSDLRISLEILPYDSNGLIFYAGPLSYNRNFPLKDFISLELRNNQLVFLVDFGGGTVQVVENQINFLDGKFHKIFIRIQYTSITMVIDDRGLSSEIRLADLPKNHTRLNVNGPLQIGGSPIDFHQLELFYNWTYGPKNNFYSGCIKNFAFNETYDLGNPAYSLYEIPKCPNSYTAASVQIHSNFYVSLLFCILALLILLLAVVVHKRQHDNWNEKDIDDIRENIINYEDEGGGEIDTDFDLNVLRQEHLCQKDLIKDQLSSKQAQFSDISGYLDDKKEIFDREYEVSPYDDVRYYAYEGDGNSGGSLSSLASCTDDGDLKFNYLSNFGPRFRKLADMYGDLSDDESHAGSNESWC